MPGGYLHGWDAVGEGWEKILCNADGELIIDPTLILEDTPTDGELEKAPTSNWAYNHKNDAAAHHAKYTDEESRAAIGDILNASGYFLKTLRVAYQKIENCKEILFKARVDDDYRIQWNKWINSPDLRLSSYALAGAYVDWEFLLYQTDHYVAVIHDDSFQTALALYLEEAPTNGVVNKAPTSNWAFDHDADASAHHTKYTDAEAQAACNLDGDLYLSIPGLAFRPTNPDTDQYHLGVNGKLTMDQVGVTVYCPVLLPDGATVTACIVDGSAGLTDETWTLWRVTNSNQATAVMGQAAGQTEDTSISNAVIDHSLYSYLISLTSMDTADELYYARLKYTL